MPRHDLNAVADVDLPIALADLHHQTRPGDRLTVEFGGRSASRVSDVVAGAGFIARSRTTLERVRTLPDTVGPNMAVLVCGLNPSPASADSGIGFARPGNRFWPAVLAAGLATVDRDPAAALAHHGLGMTDLVKRTTRTAREVSVDEYEVGAERVARLVEWLAPAAVLFVGLAGWRAVRDRRAVAGWQDRSLAGTPVYLMASTSGLNASSQLPDFVEHLRALAAGPG